MTSRSDAVVRTSGPAAQCAVALSDVERWAATLHEQHARVDPEFVDGGALRALLARRGGAKALRLLPLLALRGWGRPEAESRVALREIRAFCRVDTPDVVDLALRASVRAGLLTPGSARDGGCVRFRLTSRVLAPPTRRAVFYLPGALLASGVWAALTDDERAVLFAIGARARGVTFDDAGETWECLDDGGETWVYLGDGDEDGEGVFDWVCTHADVRQTEPQPDAAHDRFVYYAQRCGPVKARDITALTGLDQAAVRHAVARSLHRADGALLRAGPEGPEGTWYNLPEAVWGPPSRPATTG